MNMTLQTKSQTDEQPEQDSFPDEALQLHRFRATQLWQHTLLKALEKDTPDTSLAKRALSIRLKQEGDSRREIRRLGGLDLKNIDVWEKRFARLGLQGLIPQARGFKPSPSIKNTFLEFTFSDLLERIKQIHSRRDTKPADVNVFIDTVEWKLSGAIHFERESKTRFFDREPYKRLSKKEWVAKFPWGQVHVDVGERRWWATVRVHSLASLLHPEHRPACMFPANSLFDLHRGLCKLMNDVQFAHPLILPQFSPRYTKLSKLHITVDVPGVDMRILRCFESALSGRYSFAKLDEDQRFENGSWLRLYRSKSKSIAIYDKSSELIARKGYTQEQAPEGVMRAELRLDASSLSWNALLPQGFKGNSCERERRFTEGIQPPFVLPSGAQVGKPWRRHMEHPEHIFLLDFAEQSKLRCLLRNELLAMGETENCAGYVEWCYAASTAALKEYMTALVDLGCRRKVIASGFDKGKAYRAERKLIKLTGKKPPNPVASLLDYLKQSLSRCE